MTPQPNAEFFLSILIPAYNEREHIERTIGSVRRAMGAAGESDYEIVVCDNNSADRTAALAAAMGARVVFEGHNQIARARNVAARAAGGRWLIFLDADSELTAELLQSTLSRIRGGNTAAGGALIEFDRRNLGWHVSLGLGFWNTLSRLMGWAAGSFIFCLRDAWEETGGFDEKWYAAEEIGFSRALKRWGRSRGLRFGIITDHRLRTSARKIDSYTLWQMVRLLVALAVPGALKDRARCEYWYRRGP